MTLSTDKNKKTYTENGSTTVFPFPYKFFKNTDLEVWSADLQGTETKLTLNVHYTVTGAGLQAGGSITKTAAAPQNYALTIKRIVPLTQETSLRNQSKFYAEVHEDEFDRLVMQQQQKQEEVDRSIKVAQTIADTFNTQLPPAVGAQMIGFNVGGTGLTTYPGTGSVDANLLDAANAANGDALVAVKSTLTGGTARTQHTKNSDVLSVKDFGCVGDGVTDDTTALQAALTAAAGGALLIPSGTYLLINAVTISSNTLIFGAGQSSIIKSATADKTVFSASTKSNVTIRDINITITAVGTATTSGAIKLDTCTDCTIENVEIIGPSWFGVWFENSTRCTVQNCYTHDFLGSIQDCADVHVRRASVSCNVLNNRLLGGKWHGVLNQDPDGSKVPAKTIIRGNRISGNSAYGIVVYINITAAQSFVLIDGNHIDNISGTNPTGSGGCGIYCVSTGSVRIVNNYLYNCNSGTSVEDLTPGAIGINYQYGDFIIEGNIIEKANWYGVYISTGLENAFSTLIKNNSIRYPVKAGIKVFNANNVMLDGNSIIQDGTATQAAILFYDDRANIATHPQQGHIVTNNKITAFVTRPITMSYAKNFVLANNSIQIDTGTTLEGIILDHCDSGSVVGNSVNGKANTGYMFIVYITTNTAVSGNSFIYNASGVGRTLISTIGTCTGTVISESNHLFNPVDVQNAGTGANITVRSTAAPAAGTWAVGDRCVNTVPVVGQPKAWSCTVAGNPGTWVSEGNL